MTGTLTPVESWLVLRVLRGARFVYASEHALQSAIFHVLAESGLPVEREVQLDRSSRIDLMVGRVGIEVKIDYPARAVARQLKRYAETGGCDHLVLVTNRIRHRSIDPHSLAVPLDVVYIGGVV